MGTISVATECVEVAERLGLTGAETSDRRLRQIASLLARTRPHGRERRGCSARFLSGDPLLWDPEVGGCGQLDDAGAPTDLDRSLPSQCGGPSWRGRPREQRLGLREEKHETQEPICAYLQTALPTIKQEYVDLIRRMDFLGERRCDVARTWRFPSMLSQFVCCARGERSGRSSYGSVRPIAIVTAQLATGRDRISN